MRKLSKLTETNYTEEFHEAVEKAKKLYFAKDYEALDKYEEACSKLQKQAAEEYEPFGKGIRDFNEKADLHFKEEKEILEKRKKDPKFQNLLNLSYALLFTEVFSIIVGMFFPTHYNGGWGWVPLIWGLGCYIFYFIMSGKSQFVFKHKNKWPKHSWKAKDLIKASRNYNMSTDIEFAVYAVSCIPKYSNAIDRLCKALTEIQELRKERIQVLDLIKELGSKELKEEYIRIRNANI